MKESTIINNIMTIKNIIIKIHNEEIYAPDIVKEFCSNEQKYNQFIKSIDALIEAESYEPKTKERHLAFKKYMDNVKDISREAFTVTIYAKEIANLCDATNFKEGVDLNNTNSEPFTFSRLVKIKENKDENYIIVYDLEKNKLGKMLFKKYEYKN